MSRNKLGAKDAALQQRALTRWEGEGGANCSGPQVSSPDTDPQISGSRTATATEREAPDSCDERH